MSHPRAEYGGQLRPVVERDQEPTERQLRGDLRNEFCGLVRQCAPAA
jgi:hypothetical protein